MKRGHSMAIARQHKMLPKEIAVINHIICEKNVQREVKVRHIAYRFGIRKDKARRILTDLHH